MDKNGNPKAMKHVAADPAPDIAAAGARKTTRPSIATHSQKASLIFSTADPGGGGSRGGVPHAVTNSQAVTAVMHIPPVPINDIIPSGRRRAAVPQLPGVHGVLPGLPDVPHTGYVQTPVADSIGSYGSVSDRTHHFSGVGMSGAHHPAGAASRKHYGDHSNPSVNVQNILTYPDVSAGGYEAPNGVVSPSARAAAAAAAGPSHAGQLKRKPTIHDLFGAPPPVGSLGAGANASPRGGGGGGHKVNASWGAPPVGAAMMNPHHAAAVQATMQHALLRQQMAIAAGAGAGAAGGYGLPQLYGGATPSPHQFAAYQHAIQMQAAAYAFQQQQNVAAAAAAAAASAPNSHRAGGGGGDYKSPRSVSKPKRSESKRPLQIEQHPVWVPPPQAEQEIIAVPKSKITGRGRSRVPAPSAAAPPLAVEYLPPQQQQVVSPRQRRVARAGGQNQVPVQVSPRAAAAVVAAATAANAAAVAAVHPYESRNAYSRPPVAWQPYTVSDYKRLPPVRSDHGLGPDLQNEKLLQKVPPPHLSLTSSHSPLTQPRVCRRHRKHKPMR